MFCSGARSKGARNARRTSDAERLNGTSSSRSQKPAISRTSSAATGSSHNASSDTEWRRESRRS